MIKKIELQIIAIIAFVSIISLLLLFSNSITGHSAKRYNVKHISCHYLDHDASGDCVRVERQEGTRCHPPPGVIDIKYQRKSPMRLFLRLCKPMSDNTRS